MNNYLYKTPDYEGNFIYTYIENLHVVRSDSRGTILSSQPIDIVKAKETTDKGLIKSINGNTVELIHEGKVKKADRDLFNRYLLKKAIETETYQLDLPKEPVLSGTFETPIGKVRVENQPRYLREAVADPDEIISERSGYRFRKSRDNKIYELSIVKPVIGNAYVLSYSIEEDQPKEKLLKAFGVKNIFGKNPTEPKAPKTETPSGMAWNKKGGQKPGHKYIERKPHPTKPNEYIYLYELPSGKRQWKDQNGDGIPDKQANTEQSENYLDFKQGDYINYKNETYQVVDSSDNLIAVENEKGRDVIDKRTHLKNLTAHAQLNVGDEINTDKLKGKVIEKTANIALVRKENGALDFIRLEKPITKTEAPKGRKTSTLGSTEAVLSGMNTTDEFRQGNFDYESQKEYQLFKQVNEKAGYGKKNDTRYQKYVTHDKDNIWKVERVYDPATRTFDVLVNGMKDRPVSVGDRNFILAGVTEDGFYVQDSKDSEDIYMIPKEDYYNAKEAEANVVFERQTDGFGGEIISDPSEKQRYHFDGKLSPEKQAILDSQKSGRRKTSQEELQKQLVEQERKEKENARIKQEIKQALESPEYSTYKEIGSQIGFEATEDPTLMKKKVKIGNYNFEFDNKYNWKEGTSNTSLRDGTFKEVEIGGEKYQIKDMIQTEKGKYDVEYLDKDGSVKSISTDELEKLNGSRLFENGLGSKGIQSKLQPQPVYFTPEEKEIGTWEVVDLKDITISHNLDGSVNDKYTIKEAQNKDRTSLKSKQQVENISGDLGENFITFTPHSSIWADGGAPVVTSDYQVIAGNGRTLGMLHHYQNGKDEYKNNLIESAESMGFNPKEIESMEQPVVIRRLGQLDNKRIAELGALSNTKRGLAESKSEESKSKAIRIDDDSFSRIGQMLSDSRAKVEESLREDETATLDKYLDHAGGSIVDHLAQKGVILDNERSDFYDYENDTIRGEHKERLKHIILNRMFGDKYQHIEKMHSRTASGIADAMGDLMQLKDKKGDISEHLGNALEHLSRFDNNKNYGSAKDYILSEENNAINPISADPKTLAIFETLAGKTRKQIRLALRTYKADLEGDGFVQLTPEEAFNQNFRTEFPEGVNYKKDQPAQAQQSKNVNVDEPAPKPKEDAIQKELERQKADRMPESEVIQFARDMVDAQNKKYNQNKPLPSSIEEVKGTLSNLYTWEKHIHNPGGDFTHLSSKWSKDKFRKLEDFHSDYQYSKSRTLKDYFQKAIDTVKNVLMPSKKNPAVRRWQSQEDSTQLDIFANQKIDEKAKDTTKNQTEHTPQSEIEYSSKRFRPEQYHEFKNPIIGKNGAKLIGYEWRYELEDYIDHRGEEKTRRISNWSEAVPSDETGRDLVHHYYVKTADGQNRVVSSESVLDVLGFTNKTAPKQVKNAMSTVKTLAKNKMKLQQLEADKEKWENALEEAKRLEKPKVIQKEEYAPFSEKEKMIKFYMGEESIDFFSIDYEFGIEREKRLKETMTRLGENWETEQAKKISGIKYPSSIYSGIFQTKKQIEKLEKKLSEIKPEDDNILKSIDTSKNVLAPSKKNPQINRWQKIDNGMSYRDHTEKDQQEIAEKIENYFKEKGLDVVRNNSSSKTDYGVSTYIKVADKNGTEHKIRISDHSVENIDRIREEFHINRETNLEEKLPQILEQIELREKAENERQEVFEKLKLKEDDLRKKAKQIKKQNQDKGFYKMDSTYMNLEEFKSKNPTAEKIFQKDLGNGKYSYEWIDKKNGYERDLPSNEYLIQFEDEPEPEQTTDNYKYFARYSGHIEDDLKRNWSSWNFGAEGLKGTEEQIEEWKRNAIENEEPFFISGFELWGKDIEEADIRELYPGYWVLVDNTHGHGLAGHELESTELDEALNETKEKGHGGTGDGEFFNGEDAEVVYSEKPKGEWGLHILRVKQ